jgi:hypothetical protein
MLLSKFIGGSTINDAIKLALNAKYIPIFDFAKEGSKTEKDVIDYSKRILNDIDTLHQYETGNIRKKFLALKISSFNIDKKSGLLFMNEIINKANENNIMILFDAEQNSMKKIENIYINNVNTDNVFKTYQMYRKDALQELIYDLNYFKISNFKIVRGAYLNQDKKNDVLFTNKEDVDKSYDKGIKIIIDSMKKRNDIKLMAATHNKPSVNKIISVINDDNYYDFKNRIYFAQLLGMADSLTNELIKKQMNTCKYIPYGNFMETLPYLTRRLYENYDILKYI